MIDTSTPISAVTYNGQELPLKSISSGIEILEQNNGWATAVKVYDSLLPRCILGAWRGDQEFAWGQVTRVEFAADEVYTSWKDFMYLRSLPSLNTDKLKGRNPAMGIIYNNNAQATHTFACMVALETLSLPEYNTFLNHFDCQKCSSLKTVYLPKVYGLASYGDKGRGCFTGCTALENVQIGSVSYPVTDIDLNPFKDCTQSGLTITLYTTGAYADTAVANVRNGATNATIIIKAAEDTEYDMGDGFSMMFAAGKTILTSTVEEDET